MTTSRRRRLAAGAWVLGTLVAGASGWWTCDRTPAVTRRTDPDVQSDIAALRRQATTGCPIAV